MKAENQNLWKVLFFVVTPAAIALAVFVTYIVRPRMTDAVKNRLTRLERENENLKETVDRLKETRDKLKRRKGEIRSSLQESLQKISSLQSLKFELESTLETKRQKIASLKKEIDEEDQQARATEPMNEEDSESDEETEHDGSYSGASVAAQEFVEDRLKSPSTADFPWFPSQPEYLGDGKYLVDSYVDAENAMGGTVRIDYIVKVECVGTGEWRLLDIWMSQR